MASAGSAALERYRKATEGKSAEEIAAEEGVTVQTVETSLRQVRAERLFRQRTIIEEVNNELRKRVQHEVVEQVLDGLLRLLSGKKVKALVADGEVILKEVDDPKSISLGIEQFRKIVGLEEKPAPAPPVMVNVQQNNMPGPRREPERYEERLARIRARRREREKEQRNGTIDVQAEPAAEEEEAAAEEVEKWKF